MSRYRNKPTRVADLSRENREMILGGQIVILACCVVGFIGWMASGDARWLGLIPASPFLAMLV